MKTEAIEIILSIPSVQAELPRFHAEARAELEELKAQLAAKEWLLARLEFDEVTGECLIGCGGDSADGHKHSCLWNNLRP